MANNTYRADFIYRNLQIQNNVIGELAPWSEEAAFPGEHPASTRKISAAADGGGCPADRTTRIYQRALCDCQDRGPEDVQSFNIQYGTNFIAVMPTNLYGRTTTSTWNGAMLPAMIRKIHLAKCLMEDDMEAIRRIWCRRPVEGVGARVKGPVADISPLKVLRMPIFLNR